MLCVRTFPIFCSVERSFVRSFECEYIITLSHAAVVAAAVLCVCRHTHFSFGDFLSMGETEMHIHVRSTLNHTVALLISCFGCMSLGRYILHDKCETVFSFVATNVWHCCPLLLCVEIYFTLLWLTFFF